MRCEEAAGGEIADDRRRQGDGGQEHEHHHGLQADRSAAGVGSATTRAVVASIVGIIALDAVFAVCANALDV